MRYSDKLGAFFLFSFFFFLFKFVTLQLYKIYLTLFIVINAFFKGEFDKNIMIIISVT